MSSLSSWDTATELILRIKSRNAPLWPPLLMQKAFLGLADAWPKGHTQRQFINHRWWLGESHRNLQGAPNQPSVTLDSRPETPRSLSWWYFHNFIKCTCNVATRWWNSRMTRALQRVLCIIYHMILVNLSRVSNPCTENDWVWFQGQWPNFHLESSVISVNWLRKFCYLVH